jgi:hypothetical protein
MFSIRKLVPGLAACCVLAASAGGVALASTSARTAAALPQLSVTLTGKSIAVGGQEVSGGVDVVINTSGEQFGSPTFVRLNPGLTAAQAFAIIHNPQDLNVVRKVGTIVFDALAPKGTTHVQVVLQPGNYVGLDTAPAQSGSGHPYTTTFTISQSAQPASLPAPGATESAIEFGFRGPRTLHTGELVRWANAGYLVHMLDIIRTTPKFPAAKIVKLLLAGKARAIPFSLSMPAGAGPISWQAYQQQVLTIPPGTYVLACFMQTEDGRDHTMLGMERVIKVVH